MKLSRLQHCWNWSYQQNQSCPLCTINYHLCNATLLGWYAGWITNNSYSANGLHHAGVVRLGGACIGSCTDIDTARRLPRTSVHISICEWFHGSRSSSPLVKLWQGCIDGLLAKPGQSVEWNCRACLSAHHYHPYQMYQLHQNKIRHLNQNRKKSMQALKGSI